MTAALVLLLIAGAASPSAVEVTARPATTEVTVGERFTVEVQASGPEGTRFTFPERAGDERVELRALPAPPDAAADRMSYEAAVYAIEGVELPPIAVRWQAANGSSGEAASAAVPLTVGSLLPARESERTLADVRPPVGVKVAPAFWAALATLALALVGGAVLIARRRRAPVAAAALEPATPPDAEARAALDALDRSDLLDRGELRPFYIRLADIAKRYLERRLERPVLEMTSAELAAMLREHRHGRDLLPVVRDVTGAADLVKFARSPGEAEVARRQVGAVRGVVDTLERRFEAERAAAATAAGERA